MVFCSINVCQNVNWKRDVFFGRDCKLTQHKYKGLLDSGGNKLEKDKCEVNQKGKRNTLYQKFKYFLFPAVL